MKQKNNQWVRPKTDTSMMRAVNIRPKGYSIEAWRSLSEEKQREILNQNPLKYM